MSNWSEQIEEELTLLLKEWLKAKGRTQADLKKSLQASSTRMPAILDVLKKEYSKGGSPNVAARLCKIEENWDNYEQPNPEEEITTLDSSVDPFDQLDLLLEEIRDDCEP